MNFTLEQHKFFPYVAWTLVVGFAFFTYTLTLHLNDVSKTLSANTQATVAAVEESSQ